MLRVLRGFIEGNQAALGIAVAAIVIASTLWLIYKRVMRRDV